MRYIIGFVVLASVTLLMTVIPVEVSDDVCEMGKRYSMIFGQIESYKEAKSLGELNQGACPAISHDITPNKLYIL